MAVSEKGQNELFCRICDTQICLQLITFKYIKDIDISRIQLMIKVNLQKQLGTDICRRANFILADALKAVVILMRNLNELWILCAGNVTITNINVTEYFFFQLENVYLSSRNCKWILKDLITPQNIRSEIQGYGLFFLSVYYVYLFACLPFHFILYTSYQGNAIYIGNENHFCTINQILCK